MRRLKGPVTGIEMIEIDLGKPSRAATSRKGQIGIKEGLRLKNGIYRN
jgi:hypothetical protein